MADKMSILEHFARLRRILADIIYGMAIHDMVRANLRERATREHLFLLVLFGDLFGVPVLPPYYSISLLPYIVPDIHRWKRRMLRERDLLDLVG